MLAALLAVPSSFAHAQDTRTLITQAIVAFGQGKLQKALIALNGAEASTSDPATLAKIHRQRGIILEVQDQALEAMIEFRKALAHNPSVSLSAREHKGRVSALFQCAKNLDVAEMKADTIRTKFPDAVSGDKVNCPVDENGDLIPETPSPSSASTTLNETITASAPPPPEAKSWLSSPTFWIITSIAVAGSATAAGFYFAPPAGGDYGGSTDTTIRLSN